MLELTECLSLCLNLPTCKSINYETGLCVAFNTSALDHPGMRHTLYTSHQPEYCRLPVSVTVPSVHAVRRENLPAQPLHLSLSPGLGLADGQVVLCAGLSIVFVVSRFLMLSWRGLRRRERLLEMWLSAELSAGMSKHLLAGEAG